MSLKDSKKHHFWEHFDNAYWRGDLLNIDEEFLKEIPSGDDASVADLVIRAERCDLNAKYAIYAQLIERLGQEGKYSHSTRGALGYAHVSFFTGNWQICLDALHKAAVTLSRDKESDQMVLSRLRAEVCFRFADYWALFKQPGLVVSFLYSANLAYKQPSFRLLSRLRRLCSNQGPYAAALLALAVNGQWGTLFRRITDQNWDDLPKLDWPLPPAPEMVASIEGLRAAFELCLTEAFSTSGASSIKWTKHALNFALRMKSPAWIAVSDILMASIVVKEGNLELASRHLYRALGLIKAHRLEGLLIHAMLANLPEQAQSGAYNATKQADQAIIQLLSLTSF